MGVETWVLVVVVGILLWAYSKWRHSYWSSKGVASPPSLPFIGHMAVYVSGTRWTYMNKYYQKFRNQKFFGLYEFFDPVLMVKDPELLKHILVKDFEHFADRRAFGDQKGSVLSEMLGNKHGEEWKDLRAVMTPTFSSGKIKGMFPLLCEKATEMVSFSLKQARNNMPVDIKDVCGRYTMDAIATCAFGIECNSFTDSKSVFAEKASVFFDFTGLRGLNWVFLIVLPKLYNFLGFKADLPEVDFFKNISQESMAIREKGNRRGDFLDLLLEARATENDARPKKKVFGDNTLVAQSVLFLMAGYDTTASTLAFSSFLMAKYPQHQQRLRQELNYLLKEYGSITYEGIMEAKFLDAVLMESLRLYPPGTIGERKCTKQYRIPGTDVILKPGGLVQFPLWSIHHDPDYWPDAEEFQPERFLPENKGNIKSFTHLPFGMGPRNCIAMRFALMEAKVALAQLILAVDIKMAPGHEKLEFEDSPFFMRPKDGIMVLLTPLKNE